MGRHANRIFQKWSDQTLTGEGHSSRHLTILAFYWARGKCTLPTWTPLMDDPSDSLQVPSLPAAGPAFSFNYIRRAVDSGAIF